jgi:hypothetical protein
MISLLETYNLAGRSCQYSNKYQDHCTLDWWFSSQPSDSLADGLEVFLPPHLLNPATQKSSQIWRVALGIPKGIKRRMIDTVKSGNFVIGG